MMAARRFWGRDTGEFSATVPTPPPGRRYSKIAFGALNVLLLRDDGTLLAFGDNSVGQSTSQHCLQASPLSMWQQPLIALACLAMENCLLGAQTPAGSATSPHCHRGCVT
jgi:hypothetical protein